MYKIFLLAILLSVNYNLTAQNVGIGESNPSEKLDVNGRIVAKGYKNTIYEAGGISSPSVSINSDDIWTDFPDLSITFTLDHATTVIAAYSIAMESGGTNSYMMTRLAIDGVIKTRTGSGGYSSPYNNNDQYLTELAAGSHTIKVQYKSGGGGTNDPAGSDWQNRYLQILVFGSN